MGDGYDHNTLIDYKSGETIRVIAAFFIILSHAKYYIPDLHFLKLFSPWGFLGVSVFFFFSGYGTTISYFQKQNYLNGYLKKKLIGIYIPYLVALFFYTIVVFGLKISVNQEITMVTFTKSMFLVDNYLPFAWFPMVILGYYLVFYVIAKLFDRQLLFPVLLTANIIYMTVGALTHISPFYYQTSICLCIGTWFAIHPLRKSISLLLVGVMAFSLSFCLPKVFNIGFFTQLLMTAICAMGFILALYQVSYYYSLKKLTNVIGGG